LPDLGPVGPIVVSAEVGWRKPSREFFAAVITAFDYPPEQLLLVGDDFENDYVGATEAGLRAVLVGSRRADVTCVARLSDLVDC
jgi:putative hydrolase of the HAD superfamily